MKNKKVLQIFKKGRNILRTIKQRKCNWLGHILRRICLPKHVIGGELERNRRRWEERRRGKIRKQSLENSLWKGV